VEWFSKKKHKAISYSVPLHKPFSGTIIISVRPLTERLKMSVELFHNGEIKWDKYADFIDQIDKYITHFDVSVGERRFNDIHEISCFHDGARIMQDIALIVINGIPTEQKINPKVSLVKQ